MAEGKLYKCSIHTRKSGVTLRLLGKRNISGFGSTWESAYEDLVGNITLRLGDGEPRVTFQGVYPPHVGDRPWLSHEWVTAFANGECVLDWNVDVLFTQGVCGLCGEPRGVRNEEQLIASAGSSGDYCSPWFMWSSRPMTHMMKNGYSPVIVSEQFHALMSDRERDAFDWRSVRMPARSRRRYLECLPRHFESWLVHKHWDHDWLRCDECGSGEPRCSPVGNLADFAIVRITEWLSASALAEREALPFAVGQPGSYSLVWPTQTALRLSQSKYSRGMSLFHSGALADADINRSPSSTSLAQRWGDQRADKPGSDGNKW
jgi:hypothetical protein